MPARTIRGTIGDVKTSRASPQSSAVPDGEVKGVALRNFPDILASLRGDEVARQTLTAVGSDLREGLERGTIVPSGWYPLAWYRDLHLAARVATHYEPGLSWQVGRESTKRDLSGVYRVFLRVLSPGFVLSASSRFFGVYYRPGTMKVVESRPGFGRVVFGGCQGFDQHVWNDVFGGCEVTMELAGATALRIRVEQGGKDGDTGATLVAWWAGEPEPRSE